VVLPAVVFVLALSLGALGLALDQVRCVDAARAGARAASRGDSDGAVALVAHRAAPSGAVSRWQSLLTWCGSRWCPRSRVVGSLLPGWLSASSTASVARELTVLSSDPGTERQVTSVGRPPGLTHQGVTRRGVTQRGVSGRGGRRARVGMNEVCNGGHARSDGLRAAAGRRGTGKSPCRAAAILAYSPRPVHSCGANRPVWPAGPRPDRRCQHARVLRCIAVGTGGSSALPFLPQSRAGDRDGPITCWAWPGRG